MGSSQGNPKKNKGLERLQEWRAAIVCLLIGLLASFCSVAPPFAPSLQAADVWAQDGFLRVQHLFGEPGGETKDVVLVTVDDESVRALGAYPPLPRQLYGYLTKALQDAGSDVIAFQMVFDGSSPAFRDGAAPLSPRLADYIRETFDRECIRTPEGDDAAFAAELKAHHNVVLASQIASDVNALRAAQSFRFLAPNKLFVEACGGESACLGNVVLDQDADGVVRRATLAADNLPRLGGATTSFCLRVLEKKLGGTAFCQKAGISLKGKMLPRSFRINYAGGAGTFQTVPLWKALEWRKYYYPVQGDATDEAPLPNPFLHKIVVVGYQDLTPKAGALEESFPPESLAAQSAFMFNSFATPLGGHEKPMSGAEIQANMIANLLNGNAIADIPFGALMAVYLAFTAVTSLLVWRLRQRFEVLALSLTGGSLLWVAIAFFAFCRYNVFLPVAVPVLFIVLPALLVLTLYEKVFLRRVRRMQTKIFRRVASRRVAEQIDKQQLGNLGLSGKQAQVTVLVCDVFNFGDALDGLPANKGIELANQCIQAISLRVTDCGGIIERFLNHGVVAIWGAPIDMDESEQALSAAKAALAIDKSMQEIGRRWIAEGVLAHDAALPRVVVGINTGTASCGMVGTDQESMYSAVGTSIDVAYQLSAANRGLATRFLIGEKTAGLLAEQFELRELDSGAWSGTEPMPHFYELLCERGKLPGALDEAMSLYQQAMASLNARDYSQAERFLEAALRVCPEDGPSRVAWNRCRHVLSSIDTPSEAIPAIKGRGPEDKI